MVVFICPGLSRLKFGAKKISGTFDPTNNLVTSNQPTDKGSANFSSLPLQKMITVDRIPLKNVPQRYNIARSLLYTRMKDLNIKPEKDSKQAYLNADQLAQLDALDQHIKAGKTTTEFLSAQKPDHQLTQLPPLFPGFTPSIYFPSKYLHLQYLECLDHAAVRDWLLTTGEVKKLIGVSPVGARYTRGSFAFVKCGRIGRSRGWKVEKIGINTEEKSVSLVLT